MNSRAAGSVGSAGANKSSTDQCLRTTTCEQTPAKPTRNKALRTGSKVGALGTAGEMSTAAIAVSTAKAMNTEVRRCNRAIITLCIGWTYWRQSWLQKKKGHG